MTARCALTKAFLDGLTINIKNCFTLIGLTNAPRECSRMIEQPFGVRLERKRREGKSRYGQDVCWFDYKLLRTPENADGIKKMEEYVKAQSQSYNPKTEKQAKEKQLLFQ